MPGRRLPGYEYGSKRCRGYIHLYCPLRGRYVGEHRLVLERQLGRLLRPDEHVHHINGVRDDNRYENLEIVTAREHSERHRRLDRAEIRRLYEDDCLPVMAIAKRLGVSYGGVLHVLHELGVARSKREAATLRLRTPEGYFARRAVGVSGG